MQPVPDCTGYTGVRCNKFFDKKYGHCLIAFSADSSQLACERAHLVCADISRSAHKIMRQASCGSQFASLDQFADAPNVAVGIPFVK